MFKPQFLRCILSGIFPLFYFLNGNAQAPIPNGDFEQWEDRFIFEVFEPYESSNTFTFVSEVPPNVTSVMGENGGSAIRLETVEVEGGVQEGVIYAGEIFPTPAAGFPFSGNPDSLYLRIRNDIQPGDTAGLVIAFFTNGGQSGPGMFQEIVGQDTNWHTVGFDIPGQSMTPDSVTFYLASSWYDDTPGVVGSWLELDQISFDDNSSFINGDFSQVDSLFSREPIDWTSPNNFSVVFDDGDMIATEATGMDAYMGGTSLRITTQSLEFGNDSDTIAFIQNTQKYITEGEGGQAYTGLATPQTFRGYYKYSPVGNDTALFLLRFSVWDSVGDSSRVIGDFQGMTLDATSEYTSFSFDLTLTEKPDSFWIGFAASDVDHILSEAEPGIGSELYIDEIEFYDGATAIEDVEIIRGFKLYPNPATDQVNITLETEIGVDYQLSIYNLAGQKVSGQHIKSSLGGLSEYEIPLRELQTGIYILSVIDSQKGRAISKRFMVKR